MGHEKERYVKRVNHLRSKGAGGKKIVKRKRTNNNVGAVRLAIRVAISEKVLAGRSHLTVDEISEAALQVMVKNGSWAAEMGKLAGDQIKVIVRQELARRTEAGTNEFYSAGVGGSHAREYVVAHEARAETLRDNAEMRQAQIDALEDRLVKVREILTYIQKHNCTAEEAVFALYPEAQESTVAEMVATLELVAAS